MQVCLSLEFQDGVHHLLDSKIRAAAGEDDGGVAGEKISLFQQNLKYFCLLSVMVRQALENFSPQLSLGAFVAKVGLVGLAPTFLEEQYLGG